MRVFAAALNVFALTSALKLEALTEATFTNNAKIDKTTEGYKVITKEVAYIWDGCQAEKSVGTCMKGKLTGDLAMPDAAATAMTKGIDAALKEGDSKAEMKTSFQDTIFGLYQLKNLFNPVGVAAGSAPLHMSDVSATDIATLKAAAK